MTAGVFDDGFDRPFDRVPPLPHFPILNPNAINPHSENSRLLGGGLHVNSKKKLTGSSTMCDLRLHNLPFDEFKKKWTQYELEWRSTIRENFRQQRKKLIKQFKEEAEKNTTPYIAPTDEQVYNRCLSIRSTSRPSDLSSALISDASPNDALFNYNRIHDLMLSYVRTSNSHWMDEKSQYIIDASEDMQELFEKLVDECVHFWNDRQHVIKECYSWKLKHQKLTKQLAKLKKRKATNKKAAAKKKAAANKKAAKNKKLTAENENSNSTFCIWNSYQMS